MARYTFMLYMIVRFWTFPCKKYNSLIDIQDFHHVRIAKEQNKYSYLF
jgi:hypothetical protein